MKFNGLKAESRTIEYLTKGVIIYEKKMDHPFLIMLLLFLSIFIFGIFIICRNINPFVDLTHLSGDISMFEPQGVGKADM